MAGIMMRFVKALRTGKLTKKQGMVLSLILLAALIIFRKPVKILLSVAALFALGAFSTYYKRKLEGFGAVGFEFVTFTTVIAGIAFGPVVGALFGFATALVSVAISRDVGPTTVMFLIATAVIGAAAQPLSVHLGIVALGMASLAFSAIAVHSFTVFVQRDAEITTVVLAGIIVNFAVNYLLFAYAARPLLALIT